jgi:hypothetical protein
MYIMASYKYGGIVMNTDTKNKWLDWGIPLGIFVAFVISSCWLVIEAREANKEKLHELGRSAYELGCRSRNPDAVEACNLASYRYKESLR